MKKIDVSTPKRMFWSDKVPNKRRCPLCRSVLEKEYQIYFIATQSKGDPQPFVTGNEYGAFCPECPVVVLDKEGFAKTIYEMAKAPSNELSGMVQFAVLGIVDMDAIPEEKRALPLGHDDNPIPLVQFASTIEDTNKRKESQPTGKRLSGNKRRRRRWDDDNQ